MSDRVDFECDLSDVRGWSTRRLRYRSKSSSRKSSSLVGGGRGGGGGGVVMAVLMEAVEEVQPR